MIKQACYSVKTYWRFLLSVLNVGADEFHRLGGLAQGEDRYFSFRRRCMYSRKNMANTNICVSVQNQIQIFLSPFR